jgi:hypothetical protein
VKRALALVAIAAAAGLAALVAAQFSTDRPQAGRPVVGTESPRTGMPGDPNNDKVIFVRGWTQAELDEITRTFVRLYDVPPGYRIAEDKATRTLSLTFPGDIDGDLFCFLVNYIRYPKNFDLKGRRIAVIGKATLNAGFRQVKPAMYRRQARFYVPAGDTSFDVVYVEVDPGVTFEDSLQTSQWREVPDPRRPKELEDLW